MDFFSLSFASVSTLALALASPILILAYMFRKPDNQKKVPSLYILRQLRTRITFRRKVKLPLRFFLELLALLLLTLAAAKPFIADDSDRNAILVDNSLSMQAKDSSNSSRLELAKKKAKKWINESSSSRFDVFSTSPRLSKIASRVTKSGAQTALSRITSSLSSDTPTSAISELARSGEYKQIVILSDRSANFENSSKENNKNSKDKKTTEITVITVGEAISNIYFSSAQISQGENRGTYTISATAAISGAVALNAKVKLLTAESARELGSQDIKISPGNPADVVFDIDAKAKRKGYQLRLSIEPSQTNKNAIQEDDIAWLTASNSSNTKLLLISPLSNSTNNLGLNLIPGLSVQSMTPQQFSTLSNKQIERYSLLLFHRSSPRRAPHKPTLLILPPSGNPVFPVKDEQLNPSIASWAKEHPITSYLRVPLLTPKDVITFRDSLWTQPIINVEKGALVIAGESRGVRFAGVGMELLPFEGMRTPSSTVLFLNLLSWLGGGTNLSAVMNTGHILPLKKNTKWNITDPTQKQHTIDTRDISKTELHSFTLDLPGLYTLQNILDKDSKAKTLAVNSLFPEESSTFDTLPLGLQKSYLRPPKIGKESEPLWPMLLIAAFTILSIDYFLRAWSKNSSD